MSGSKNCYIYTSEYYTAEGKKELLLFTTAWMQLERTFGVTLNNYIVFKMIETLYSL